MGYTRLCGDSVGVIARFVPYTGVQARDYMDPKTARRTARDAMWVIAGAFVVFPVVAMLITGFDVMYLALFIVAGFIFLAGVFAGWTGLA